MLLFIDLCHNGADESKDGVELRKGGVDKGVGEHVVTLADADDTVGADHTLTDRRDHTYKTCLLYTSDAADE